MDKPEEKSGPLRPPHPPPGAKKPGTPLPKGPVPPKGGMQLPGMKPMAKPPTPMGGQPPAMPPARPPMGQPPMAPPGVRPPMASPPGMPPRLPAAPGSVPPPAAGGPLTPAISEKFAEADSAKNDMEQKIADLEKKLLEEREKVLLASLRSKEEEAVSAKVETSIKDIQDKLRRERRDQELDEARRKAEARALDLERRMAEEREAWVSTLKGQLGQRDQITQEMETHFSTRLKDLEYRWGQEKASLENAVREREADLTRVRHEAQIKSEQEKASWEDRVKSIAAERDKLERDFERAKDKFSQEKDYFQIERQGLREQITKAENSLKFIEDHHRSEKSSLQREAEVNLTMIKQQATLEKDALQKQMEFRLAEKEKALEEARRRASEVVGLTDNERKRYELDIERLTNELHILQMTKKDGVSQLQNEYETRIKTLQTRLDWYDSNVRREYDNARMQVQEELNQLQLKLKEAEKTIELIGPKAENLVAVKQELDQVKSDWKQSQWNMEEQLKEVNDALRSTQSKLEQAEEARISLEQELRQRSSNATYNQAQMEQRETELRKMTDQNDILKKELEFLKQKDLALDSQMEEYKKLLQGKGLKALDDVQAQLDEKTTVLEKAKETIHKLNAAIGEAEKKDELYKDKERSFKQILSEKDEITNEFKNRVMAVDRKIHQIEQEYQEYREQVRKENEKSAAQRQAEIELAKRTAAEEMAEKIRAELPPPGPNAGVIESQVRQDIENEFLDRMRDKETEIEEKVAQAKEESKKEVERLKWEAEGMKEELKRTREARIHIEREAQELLQQAEAHYQREIAKHLAGVEPAPKPATGFFSTIGRILDTPIIDTKKKKKDDLSTPS